MHLVVFLLFYFMGVLLGRKVIDWLCVPTLTTVSKVCNT